MRRYIVLSDQRLGGTIREFSGDNPPQPRIEVQSMSPHDVADVRRKPGALCDCPDHADIADPNFRVQPGQK